MYRLFSFLRPQDPLLSASNKKVGDVMYLALAAARVRVHRQHANTNIETLYFLVSPGGAKKHWLASVDVNGMGWGTSSGSGKSRLV